MSDTTKLVLGIVLAIVVIALIIWLLTSGRRRETEARRLEAQEVRARLEERLTEVKEKQDRASVTERIAEEARREAEAKAAEAARLEKEAAAHRASAEQLAAEQAELARVADRIDPDVRTDDEGYRIDDSGRRLATATVASAFGAAALAQEDDEPDLADHENPFAGYAAGPASTDPRASEGGGAVEADWVNGPVDEEAADEVEALAATDAQAADWINGDDDEDHSVAPETPVAPMAATSAGVADSLPGHDDEGDRIGEAEADWVNGPVDEDAADWVNGPVDEGAADEAEALAATDAGAADWINGDDDGAPFDRPADQPTASAAAGTRLTDTQARGPQAEAGLPEAQAAEDAEDSVQAPPIRRVSALEEVADGGYGVGSAAPLRDGAQPLGHPIMGFRDTMTYSREAERGLDVSPDVWFYDEDAARRSGFRAADQG